MITTNDLKKGTRIKLANGWYGTLTDSRKGNIREAEVEGLYTEIGSVYGHDIVQALVPVEAKRGTGGKEWMAILHTPAQVKARKMSGDIFGFHYTDKTEAGIDGEGEIKANYKRNRLMESNVRRGRGTTTAASIRRSTGRDSLAFLVRSRDVITCSPRLVIRHRTRQCGVA